METEKKKPVESDTEMHMRNEKHMDASSHFPIFIWDTHTSTTYRPQMRRRISNESENHEWKQRWIVHIFIQESFGFPLSISFYEMRFSEMSQNIRKLRSFVIHKFTQISCQILFKQFLWQDNYSKVYRHFRQVSKS